MKKQLSLFTMITMFCLLVSVAFAGPFDGTHDEDTAKGITPEGTVFNQTLYNQYLNLSKERDNLLGTDRTDAELFNHKALLAGRNSAVQNDSVYDRELKSQERVPFFIAQERLYMVFDKGGRELAAVETATAQVAYDCWIEATEGKRPKDANECRQRFEDAMAKAEEKAGYEIAVLEVEAPVVVAPTPEPVIVPVPPQEYYVLPFEFDTTTLTPEGEEQLAKAINDIGTIEELKISLRAHADRAGPENYNIKLSQRRAETVLNRLANAGVRESRIRIVEAVGESRSLVPTADGVRNQANRVVEIDLRQ